MNSSYITSSVWQPRWACLLCFVLWMVGDRSVMAVETLFDPPRTRTIPDEILLISTRGVGTVCDGETMRQDLRCQRLVNGSEGKTWKKSDWRRLISTSTIRPTVFYVHGNRVAEGKDREQGLQVYRSLKRDGNLTGPIRFVIWSWPSAQIPGPIKDYVVKAQRTTPAAWQLAWVMDKLPVESQISLVGYSYGTRVVSGAAHLLAGGSLGELALDDRVHPDRPPVRAALIAAAFDADWVQPGQSYGRSLAEFDRLVLATNKLDPAMRFYHLSNGRGKMHALGRSGVHQPQMLGNLLSRLRQVDFTEKVGRSHAIVDYLAAAREMSSLWREVVPSWNPGLTSTSSAKSLVASRRN